MKFVYLVCTKYRLVGVYGTETAAMDAVEHTSVVDYGYRNTDEIWAQEHGNEDVWYKKTKVQYE